MDGGSIGLISFWFCLILFMFIHFNLGIKLVFYVCE